MSLKEFQIIEKLGEGAYSSVYKVKRHGDGQEYALKKVKLQNLSEKEKQNALNEIRILASIRSNNIVSYKQAFLDEFSNSLCIIMEYADNGDLFQKIVEHQKKGQLFAEQEIWNIFIAMVKGIKALHDLKIFHRDLKSANIFLNKDGGVKLGDMNVSKVAKKGLLYTQTGTPYYASPEVWKDQPYDAKSDIWSLGCVLYEMITLKPPFRAEDMEGLYKKVIRGYYPRIPPHFSQDLANVVRALLQVAPHLRPSADKILQLPVIVKRVNDQHLLEADEGIPILLTTIRVPKNMHYLTEKLPKPNYAPLKTKKIDRNRFLSTIAGYKGERSQSAVQDAQEQDEMQGNSISNASMPNSMLPPIHLPKINPKINKGNSGSIQQDQQQSSHNNSINIPNNDSSSILSRNYLISSPQRENNINNNKSEVSSLNNQSILNAEQSSVKKKIKKKPEGVDPSTLPLYHNSNEGALIYQQQQPQGINRENKNSSPSKQRKLDQLLAYNSDLPTDIVRAVKYRDGSPKNRPSPQLKHQGQGSLSYLQSHQVMNKNIDFQLCFPHFFNWKKPQEIFNLLDIEGESKPLNKKSKKDNISSNQLRKIEESSLLLGNNHQDDNRLPAIGITKLPKIISVQGKQLGYGSGESSISAVKLSSNISSSDKENQRLRDLSKAYKLNINQLDGIKDKYSELKIGDSSNPKQKPLKKNISSLQVVSSPKSKNINNPSMNQNPLSIAASGKIK